jgi:hypothetical protein
MGTEKLALKRTHPLTINQSVIIQTNRHKMTNWSETYHDTQAVSSIFSMLPDSTAEIGWKPSSSMRRKNNHRVSGGGKILPLAGQLLFMLRIDDREVLS